MQLLDIRKTFTTEATEITEMSKLLLCDLCGLCGEAVLPSNESTQANRGRACYFFFSAAWPPGPYLVK